ncbi:uncharacterized protein YALI1_C17314g [Yarrowia lipolytica]|uniref:Uncharacterized protein n=1 Tax=Yarrowia lipolytica TaxID=4952 RepID=A0A1D8NAS7_YARLL|nr:hypothetical protein YALI1_C17314g [Yarrowia lipolytica]
MWACLSSFRNPAEKPYLTRDPRKTRLASLPRDQSTVSATRKKEEDLQLGIKSDCPYFGQERQLLDTVDVRGCCDICFWPSVLACSIRIEVR